MREHPIPQDVTGYKFHIIGNLTLKQFIEVAGGVVLAFVFYKISLPTILKWPLLVTSLALGGLSAFVPIAGRSFDQWIITFFKVIYRPTLYYWKRVPQIPDIFSFQPKNPNRQFQPEVDLLPQKHQRVDEYLASVNYTSPPTNQMINQPTQTESSETQRINQVLNYFADNQVVNQQIEATTDQVPIAPKHQTATDAREANNNESVANKPDSQPPVKPTPMPNNTVIFNQNLPLPSIPTQANKLVGMVLTQNNDLIPNAIIEVYNQAGVIERAVKSNALGQFFITTPLPNGTYTLKTNKDGLVFEPLSLELVGNIVPPLKIIAS
jgi:hypothetical protein